MTPSPHLRIARWLALIVGLVAAAACAWGLFAIGDRAHFFRAYLFAWMFCLGLTLGSLCVLMLHNVIGGEWAATLRIISHRAALTLPLIIILGIPLLFGLRDLYVWANPANVAASAVLQHRAAYLNIPFFCIRAALYFLIWLALIWILTAWQKRWEATGEPRYKVWLRRLSAPGLIIYLMTMTHAGTDWLMSRDIDYFSTAFGFVLTLDQTLVGTAFAIIIAAAIPVRAERRSILAAATGRGVLNDVGNIVLTLVILWSYVAFMEFLVIWMGNSREDNAWFLQRGLGQPDPWRWVGLSLILAHFFIPFYLLLFRATKQYIPALVGVAWLLFLSDIVNVYWLVAPSGAEPGPRFDLHWLDVAAFAALVGLWLSCLLWLLPARWQPSPMYVHPEEYEAVTHG